MIYIYTNIYMYIYIDMDLIWYDLIRLKSARTEGAEAWYWNHFRTEQGAKKCTGLWHFADRLNIVHVTATSAQAGVVFGQQGPKLGPTRTHLARTGTTSVVPLSATSAQVAARVGPTRGHMTRFRWYFSRFGIDDTSKPPLWREAIQSCAMLNMTRTSTGPFGSIWVQLQPNILNYLACQGVGWGT